MRPHTLDTPFSLPVNSTQTGTLTDWPMVEIAVSYAGVGRIAIDALIASGVRGIVVAGTGNGSIHATLQQALVDAVQQSVVVVRASRAGSGSVLHDAQDNQLGFVAAGTLNPYKARVLLLLALAQGFSSPEALQDCFDTF
jgi:L-asparaginase